MADDTEPAGHGSHGCAESDASHLPPPSRAYESDQLPPPPLVGAPIARPRMVREVRTAIVALSLSAVGWLVWLFAWMAQSDAGYPDGLACTAHSEASTAYASCMRGEERGGTIAWSLTLGLAVAGIVMVVRSRQGKLLDAGARSWALAASAFSGLLAFAGVGVWVRGASGGFYEDRLGATAWHLTMVIAIAAGLIVGWAVARHQRDRV